MQKAVLIMDNQYSLILKNFGEFIKHNKRETIIAIGDVPSSVDKDQEIQARYKLIRYPHIIDLGVIASSSKRISAIIDEFNIGFLFVECYRVLDQLWIGVGNQKGVKTVHVQHGFEIDHVNYSLFTLWSKFSKGIKVLTVLSQLSIIVGESTSRLCIDYFRYIYFKKSPNSSSLSSETLHPVINVVYSAYYKGFWRSKFGLNGETRFVQYPDLYRQPWEEGGADVLYIAQTLVEDGRMSEKSYERVLKDLDIFVKENNLSLKIKLHPRSNIKLYRNFKPECFTRKMLRSKLIINHYSSLLFLVGLESQVRIILWELDGHKTPEIFENCGDIKVGQNELKFINPIAIELNSQRINYCKQMTGMENELTEVSLINIVNNE